MTGYGVVDRDRVRGRIEGQVEGRSQTESLSGSGRSRSEGGQKRVGGDEREGHGASSQKATNENENAEAIQTWDNLMNFLRQLDKGWECALTGNVWHRSDPSGRETPLEDGEAGADDAVPQEEHDAEDGEGEQEQEGGEEEEEEEEETVLPGKAMSITDKIRLRSSILSLREKLLMWSEHERKVILAAPGVGVDVGTSRERKEKDGRVRNSETRRSTTDDSSASEVDGNMEVDEGEGEESAQSGKENDGIAVKEGFLQEMQSWDADVVSVLNTTLEMLAL